MRPVAPAGLARLRQNVENPNRNANRVARIFYVSRFVAIRSFGGFTTDEIVRPRGEGHRGWGDSVFDISSFDARFARVRSLVFCIVHG